MPSLLDLLDLLGKVWIIDLPGSGNNVEEGVVQDCEEWFEIFPLIIGQFSNPILDGRIVTPSYYLREK